MKRPQTNVEIMTANLLKAELWDKLIERIAVNEIVVRPTDSDGGEMDKVLTDESLRDLVKGQGDYADLFQ